MTQTVIVVIYLGLLLSLGYLSSRLFRGNSNDYFVASRSIGPLVLFMSIFGTTMTAFARIAMRFGKLLFLHTRPVSCRF